MRITDIIGLIGALLAASAWIFMQIAGETLPFQIAQYVGLVGVLFWIYYNIENLLASFATRAARQGGVGLLITALAFALFIGANFIAHRHPKSFDTTDKGLFTLAPQTHKIVTGLTEPLRILAFFQTTQEEKGRFSDLLDQYRTINPNITVQWIDYDYEPALAQQYEIRRPGTVLLEMAGDSHQLTALSEEALTNGIISLTQTEQRTIFFLTGHNERASGGGTPDLPGMGQAASELKKKGFLVEELNIVEEEGFPDEARVLVIASPQREPLPREIKYIENFLARGGRVFLLIDKSTPETFLAMAKSRGIALPNAVIVDPVSQAMVGDATSPYIGPADPHEITDSLSGSPMLLNMARPVLMGTPPEGISLAALTTTTPNAWGETDLSAFEVLNPESEEESQTLRFDEGKDFQGPLSVMVLARWTATTVDGFQVEQDSIKLDAVNDFSDIRDTKNQLETEGMLAVVGDSDFASDSLFSMFFNGDLFLNTVSYMAKAENLISIRPRETESSPFIPTAQQGLLLSYSSLLILPGISFLIAFIMHRRKKRM